MEDLNNIDLIEELAKATEPRATEPSPSVENALQIAPVVSSDDFEAAPPIEDEPEAEPESINAEDLTDLIIDGGEMIMEKTFPILYEKTLAAEDRKVLRELIKTYKNNRDNKKEIVLTEELLNKQDVFFDYDDYCSSLELSTKEKKNLRTPLKKVLANVNFQTTPQNALMAVCLMIFLPRVLPLLKNKML